MRRHPILATLGGLYLLLVGLWPAAAVPAELVATGGFTVLAQPAVLLAVFLGGLAATALRRPAPARTAHARRH
ncbi:hypothetical protein [Streptomyces sp. NPDC001652]|uniref:hypothetical protein n=1 Tax=Streptomyces sp. NPDC001652 TaxID=3154393 RepID=UPI003317A83C